MDADLNFEFCSDSRGKTINIFIHGYSAVRGEKDKEKLKFYIPERIEAATNIFAFWPSGIIFDNTLTPNKIITTIASGALLSAAYLSYEEIQRFKSIEKSINDLTYKFFIKMNDFIINEGISYDKINLYGHSLGARLIIESLINSPSYYKDLKIENLIFMGGARCLHENECQKLLDVISGKIFNIYSSADYILKFVKPDFEKCIGIYPIQAPRSSTERVKNHAFNFFGHIDYWENIGGIINYFNLDKTSSTYLLPGYNTQDNNSFPTNDIPLYVPVSYATDSEKEILARLLCFKSSHSISDTERNPVELTHEIQLMGGDSIMNKLRGHGVLYTEIVHDAAEKLNIKDYQGYGFRYLEKAILDETLSILKSKKSSSDEYQKIHLTKIANGLYTHAVKGEYSQSDMTHYGQLAEFMSNQNIVSLNITGPAYSIIIPIIIIIYHIRNRLIKEMGDSFLSIYR